MISECISDELPPQINFFEYGYPHSKALLTYLFHKDNEGAQWLSGRVIDSRPRGHGFEPQRCHCVVVLEQDTFILA